MLKPKKQLRGKNVRKDQESTKSVFVIPNPFDDFVREKKEWFSKVRKMEMLIKSMKQRVSELNSRQVDLKHQLQYNKSYCASLVNGKKR